MMFIRTKMRSMCSEFNTVNVGTELMPNCSGDFFFFMLIFSGLRNPFMSMGKTQSYAGLWENSRRHLSTCKYFQNTLMNQWRADKLLPSWKKWKEKRSGGGVLLHSSFWLMLKYKAAAGVGGRRGGGDWTCGSKSDLFNLCSLLTSCVNTRLCRCWEAPLLPMQIQS